MENNPERGELIKRMQRRGNKQRREFSDAPFEAEYRKVVLPIKARTGASGAASGDCELLEQIRDRLLPKLNVKVVKDNLRCIPYQGIVGNLTLEVEALIKSRS